jgi:hypothetical protein
MNGLSPPHEAADRGQELLEHFRGREETDAELSGQQSIQGGASELLDALRTQAGSWWRPKVNRLGGARSYPVTANHLGNARVQEFVRQIKRDKQAHLRVPPSIRQ